MFHLPFEIILNIYSFTDLKTISKHSELCAYLEIQPIAKLPSKYSILHWMVSNNYLKLAKFLRYMPLSNDDSRVEFDAIRYGLPDFSKWLHQLNYRKSKVSILDKIYWAELFGDNDLANWFRNN